MTQMIPHLIAYRVCGFETPPGHYVQGVEIETDLPLAPATKAARDALVTLREAANETAAEDGGLRVLRIVRRC